MGTICLSLLFTAPPNTLYFLVCLLKQMGIWHFLSLWEGRLGNLLWLKAATLVIQWFIPGSLLISTPDSIGFMFVGNRVQKVIKEPDFLNQQARLFRNYYSQDITNIILLLNKRRKLEKDSPFHFFKIKVGDFVLVHSKTFSLSKCILLIYHLVEFQRNL